MHQGKHQEYEKRLHDVLIASSSGFNGSNGSATSTSSSNTSKNSDSTKTIGISSSSVPMNGTSVSLCVTTNNLSSAAVSSNPQKEAWPSLSTSPVNQKDATSNNGNKNKKERTKQEKNKNGKIKTKTSINNIQNTALNPLPKEVDFPVIGDSSPTNSNNLNEQPSKSKLEKSKDRNQHCVANRSNAKKELNSNIENEMKGFDTNSKTTNSTSLNLDSSGEFLSSKINNDNNISKLDSQRSLSSSSNSSSSCIITASENNSLFDESISGKSSPGGFAENHVNEENTKSTNSALENKTDSNNDEDDFLERSSKSYIYPDNLLGKSENTGSKASKDNNTTNKIDRNLYFKETVESNRYENIDYNELLLKDNAVEPLSGKSVCSNFYSFIV